MSIQSLVSEYNAGEAAQDARRRAIIAALAAAGNHHRSVTFANGEQLSDHSLSEPVVVGPFLARLSNPIIKVEGGE